MRETALIELTLKTLSCSQKQLAIRLGVSETQVSKWKKGEHMSHDMEQKLRSLADIGDRDPEFVLWAGSCSEVDKWENLVRYLADFAKDQEETGYDTFPLEDEFGLLCWETLSVLKKLGVNLPHQVPNEISFDYEAIDNESDEESSKYLSLLLEDNPYSSVIYKLFLSLNSVWGFYYAYMYELIMDDDLDLMSTDACNIEPCLLDLAACKLEEDNGRMPNLKAFRHRTLEDFEKWINIVKNKAFRAGIPLRAELMELLTLSDDELGEQAEAESLGLNSGRIHPDVYMNEILCSLRLVHQVLPAILKKLDIDFKADPADLYLK